jgi:hypothetical protein
MHLQAPPLRTIHKLLFWSFFAALLALTAIAFGQAPAAAAPSDPYGPYKFLIGEWDVVPEGGGPAAGVARLKWGPNKSYIWYSMSLLDNGAERPHFEGILVWNGVQKNLDMLLSMDLEHGLVQEKGFVTAEPDGTVVREITASYSEGVRAMGGHGSTGAQSGATAKFRQTFKAAGPDRILTRALRDSPHGWIATFPGSDRLAMTRRTK